MLEELYEHHVESARLHPVLVLLDAALEDMVTAASESLPPYLARSLLQAITMALQRILLMGGPTGGLVLSVLCCAVASTSCAVQAVLCCVVLCCVVLCCAMACYQLCCAVLVLCNGFYHLCCIVYVSSMRVGQLFFSIPNEEGVVQQVLCCA